MNSASGTLREINSPTAMRRFFLLLMIALLPLRSWAGDVMALSMSAPTPALAVSMATQTLTAPPVVALAQQASADMKDCPGHSDSSSETALAGAAAVDDGPCKTCVSCQICHSMVLVNVDVAALAAQDANRLKSPSAVSFASAALADSVKPPIS